MDTQESTIIHIEAKMRTNIDIDDDLMRQALRASGERTSVLPWSGRCACKPVCINAR